VARAAETEGALWRVAEEVGRTRRKVNALEKRVITDLVAARDRIIAQGPSSSARGSRASNGSRNERSEWRAGGDRQTPVGPGRCLIGGAPSAMITIHSYIHIYKYVAVRERIKLLKALADETRMKIVQCLLGGERCACKLVPAVGRAQPTVSQHLRILEEAGVLESRRVGVNIWYRIRSDQAVRILEILDIPRIEIEDTCTEEPWHKIPS